MLSAVSYFHLRRCFWQVCDSLCTVSILQNQRIQVPSLVIRKPVLCLEHARNFSTSPPNLLELVCGGCGKTTWHSMKISSRIVLCSKILVLAHLYTRFSLELNLHVELLMSCGLSGTNPWWNCPSGGAGQVKQPLNRDCPLRSHHRVSWQLRTRPIKIQANVTVIKGW